MSKEPLTKGVPKWTWGRPDGITYMLLTAIVVGSIGIAVFA